MLAWCCTMLTMPSMPPSWLSRPAALLLLQHTVESLPSDGAAPQRGTHVALEALTVGLEILSGLLVERVRRIGFEEEELWHVSSCACPHLSIATHLESNHRRVQVQHGLPVLS